MLKFPPIDHTKPLNEYDSTEQVFVNAYPWLFPGGIGDVYDPIRGKVKDIYEWAKHLLRFHDASLKQHSRQFLLQGQKLPWTESAYCGRAAGTDKTGRF
eukprot:scaffold27359_cov174-Skeletonema_marinoi.AAC.1